jgi:hypothetical protein
MPPVRYEVAGREHAGITVHLHRRWQRRVAHHLAGVRRLDHLAVADVHLDMAESVAEHQVTGLQLTAAEVVGVGPLIAGEVRQAHAAGLPRHHDQSGAVEPVRTRSAPHIRLTELRFGVSDRRRAAPGFPYRSPRDRRPMTGLATGSRSMLRDRREPDRRGWRPPGGSVESLFHPDDLYP